MADLPIPQLELFQSLVPPPGLIPQALDAALTMLLRELMQSVIEDASAETVEE
jgi:hypothetical protein